MFASQKSTKKQGTRGQKTILDENAKTLTFYKYLILVVMSISLLVNYFIFPDSMNKVFWGMHALVTLLYFCAYKFMDFMGQPRHSPDGTIVDAGLDLNMESGMAEHCKDILLLTAGTQLLALFSSYLWFTLLLAPVYGFYLFWVYVAAPWIFAEAPEAEKKSKRLEKRELRQSKFRRA